MIECKESICDLVSECFVVITFYQTGPNGLFIFLSVQFDFTIGVFYTIKNLLTAYHIDKSSTEKIIEPTYAV